MGDLPARKGPCARAMIEADTETVETAFPKPGSLPGNAAEVSRDAAWAAIGRLIDRITSGECPNLTATAKWSAM